MDTLYMKERAYRLVETLRRVNKREQRRLDQKLFSKQGLVPTHKMELLALAEEEKKIREDLTRIKRSSATSWGLLPPRQGEPDFDEDFLRTLNSMDRSGSDRVNNRKVVTGRPLLASYSEAEFHRSDPVLHLSHIDSPDQMGEPSKPRRLRKQSLIKLDEESRRTEKTLKKFNQVFPSDGIPEQISNRPKSDDSCAKEIETENTGSHIPPEGKQVGDGRNQAQVPEEETNGNVDVSNTGVLLPVIEPGIVESNRKNSMDTSQKTKNSHSINAIKRRKNSLSTKDAKNTRRLSRGPFLAKRKTLQNVNEENDIIGHQAWEPASIRKSSSSVPSMHDLDVQDARDKIVKRLVANDSLAKTQKANNDTAKETAKEDRPLSPIREQRTDLSTQSMPQIVTDPYPSNAEFTLPKPSKKETKVKGNEDELPKFDSYRYNPDGSLRTMHILPDFNGSLEEAMKARYIRHSEKQWYEKELSVNEMFEDR